MHDDATVTASTSTRPLPAGWRWARLGEVIREAQGGFASGEREPQGVIQLRMNNVTNRGGFDWSSFIRVPADTKTVATYQLQTGDVLFNNTNSTELVGKSALFESHNEPVVYSNHFTRLRTVADWLSPAFLAFWLQAQWRQRVFADICNRWIGQSAVQRDKLLALEMPLPPLPEQRRIAALLAEQMAAGERARRAAEAQVAAAKALPAAYLRAVFESDEARRWPQGPLGTLLRLRKEIVHPRDQPSGPATFVGLEHIESHTGRRIGAEQVEMSQLTGRKPRFFTSDIVYGYLRPYLNKVWVANFDGLCSVDQYVYQVRQDLADTTFVSWFMRSPSYLDRAPIDTTPGQLPRIRTEEVAGVELGLPSLTEQRRIATMLAEQMAVVERTRTVLAGQLDAINRLPAALLRQAFSGELARPHSATMQTTLPQGIFFTRGAIASYVVERLHTQRTFGRVQLEKLIYLTEAHIRVDLRGQYRREAAGPFDSGTLYPLEHLAYKQGWFTKHPRGAEGFYYRPGPTIAKRCKAAEAILGDRREEMDRLLDLFAGIDTEQAEIATTLFAAWNDLLIDGQQPDDERVIREVRENWHVSKSRFTVDRLHGMLAWMRQHYLVPRGVGPRTERPK